MAGDAVCFAFLGPRLARASSSARARAWPIAWKVVLGEHCWVGDHAEIYNLAPITIGRNSVVSQRSYLCAGTHDHGDLAFPLVGRPITIGDEVWIATDCFVAPGVQIGDGAIVAARSTVLTNITEGMVVAGNPAIVKKRREPSHGSPLHRGRGR